MNSSKMYIPLMISFKTLMSYYSGKLYKVSVGRTSFGTRRCSITHSKARRKAQGGTETWDRCMWMVLITKKRKRS